MQLLADRSYFLAEKNHEHKDYYETPAPIKIEKCVIRENHSHNHRSRHLVTVCFRNLGHVPPLSSNDSPVGGADAKHQIVIGLFVLGSLKIPRPRFSARLPGGPVMLDGGIYGYIPILGKSKRGPPQKTYLNARYLSKRAIFHIHDCGRKGKSGEVWTWLKPFWHSKRSANNHQRHHSREPGLDPRPLKRIFTAPCPTVSMMPQRYHWLVHLPDR